MRSALLALILVLAGCCGGPALDTLIEVEVGAQTKDLQEWDKLSDAEKKQSAEQSLEAMLEVRNRLGD